MARYEREIERAIKQRILEELANKQQKQAAIVNNLYGSHDSGHAGGLQDRFSPVEDALDYFVDISREPGEAEGSWKKTVHRYAKPKEGTSKRKIGFGQ